MTPKHRVVGMPLFVGGWRWQVWAPSGVLVATFSYWENAVKLALRMGGAR